MRKPKEEIPHKFWREYESSDIIEREEKLNHIINNIDQLFKLKNEKVRKRALKLSLRCYFDDLMDYMGARKGE